jgi:hypothetical protein
MKFKGRTEDAAAPFLNAEFWKVGVKVIGKVTRCFESENGPCAVIRLAKPIQINSEDYQEVSIGNLKGFVMALQAAGLNVLRVNDTIYAECTGFSETTKGHNRANFEIEVERHPEANGAHA